jgi:multiple sugar transport system permease protein
LSGAGRWTRLGWLLCAPALVLYAAVAAWPLAYAAWLSLFRNDLRFPAARAFVGLGNYGAVLTDPVWWRALGATAGFAVSSVAIELVLGMGIAVVLHRTTVGRGLIRASALVPYALVTVVAALAWKFAFEPATGFVPAWLGSDRAWLAHPGSAFAIVLATEVWKTTPFVAAILLAGLALVPDDVLRAARVDGASEIQAFLRVTLPLLRPAILAAVLFRAIDALRIFDTVFVETRGAQGTETISMVAYDTLIVRLNLGLGSAVAVLVFACVVLAAWGIARAFGRGAAPIAGGGA